VFYDGASVAAVGYPRWVMVSGPGTDDPLMGLYRDPVNTSVSAEWFWITDGNGRQFASAPGTGAINSAADQQYRVKGGAYAGGTTQSDTYAGSRFESPQAPGFSFFRNRVYDQATGRWTQEDPIGIAGGVNLYQYNGNNPVSYTDPFGLFPFPGIMGNLPGRDASLISSVKYIVDKTWEHVQGDLHKLELLIAVATAGEGFLAGGGGAKWALGGGKSAGKWASQMETRGWTAKQITEAIESGEQHVAKNLVNEGNTATRYVHPTTGRSVVVDNETKEVIHVGGDGFKYDK